MSFTVVGNCIHCQRPMRSDYARRKGVMVEGAETTAAGRGRCVTCYSRIRRHGSPEFKPLEARNLARPGHNRAPVVPAEYVLEDWELLRSEGLTWKQAAPRIGMSESAFAQALRRARKRGDERGNLSPHNDTRSDAA